MLICQKVLIFDVGCEWKIQWLHHKCGVCGSKMPLLVLILRRRGLVSKVSFIVMFCIKQRSIKSCGPDIMVHKAMVLGRS